MDGCSVWVIPELRLNVDIEVRWRGRAGGGVFWTDGGDEQSIEGVQEEDGHEEEEHD